MFVCIFNSIHLLQAIFNQDLKNYCEIIYRDVLYYFSI